MKKIAEEHQAQQGTGDEATELTKVYAEAMETLKAEKPDAKLGDVGAFASREDAERWLREQLKESPDAPGLVKRYNEILDTALRTQMDKLRDEANSIRAVFDQTRFQLIPVPYHEWSDLQPGGWLPTNRHLWGIIVSGLLLSLGAPFWFNALKTLTNLRPVLARKEEQEKQKSKS